MICLKNSSMHWLFSSRLPTWYLVFVAMATTIPWFSQLSWPKSNTVLVKPYETPMAPYPSRTFSTLKLLFILTKSFSPTYTLERLGKWIESLKNMDIWLVKKIITTEIRDTGENKHWYFFLVFMKDSHERYILAKTVLWKIDNLKIFTKEIA